MSLGTIRFTPSMSQTEMATALNQNFALLENLNTTQIFKDETGTQRILLGRAPNGEYVLAISKPGIDVVKALDT